MRRGRGWVNKEEKREWVNEEGRGKQGGWCKMKGRRDREKRGGGGKG